MSNENNVNNNNNENQKFDVLIIVLIVALIGAVSLFNFIVDPFYIIRNSSIKSFNNIKLHKFTNKRTMLYSDIKYSHNRKDTAFVGNCLLSRYNSDNPEVAFYTIPVATVDEVIEVIHNIHVIAPNIKKIYWGMMFQDMWYDKNDEVMDNLKELDDKNFNISDFVRLFFSWNTTKYSIDTVLTSIKNKGRDIIYIYPYKEIAAKKYNSDEYIETIDKIRDVVKFAKDNGIELNIYYSPNHVSKRVHMYLNNAWDKDSNFKRLLADITPFYDFSLLNEKYNMSLLDENNIYFVDNIHPTDVYNNIVLADLLGDKHEIGILINKDNVDNYLESDKNTLLKYMEENPEITEKIKNLVPEDVKVTLNKKLSD